MTTTLYLVRHAEAEGNWKRTFQGHIDSEVSEKGWTQPDYLARRFELQYEPEQTLVTVGGSEAIDLAIRALVQPGD